MGTEKLMTQTLIGAQVPTIDQSCEQTHAITHGLPNPPELFVPWPTETPKTSSKRHYRRCLFPRAWRVVRTYSYFLASLDSPSFSVRAAVTRFETRVERLLTEPSLGGFYDDNLPSFPQLPTEFTDTDSDDDHSTPKRSPAPPRGHPLAMQESTSIIPAPCSVEQLVSASSRLTVHGPAPYRTIPFRGENIVMEDEYDIEPLLPLVNIDESRMSDGVRVHHPGRGEQGPSCRWYYVTTGREVGVFNNWYVLSSASRQISQHNRETVSALTKGVPENNFSRTGDEISSYKAFTSAAIDGLVFVKPK